MKISLPKTQKGFTLVELLVVISIIAILAVIGLSVFAGAQAQARDGRRRAEIDALAKAIETSWDIENKEYVYSATNFTDDFPNGVLDDPKADWNYCLYASTSLLTSGTNPAATKAVGGGGAGADCPTGGGNTYAAFSTANLEATDNIKGWIVCASLERSNTPFCLKSLQR